jgi:hypothetical protein
MELPEVHAAVAAETVGMRPAVRESESSSTVVSGSEMAVSATEMPSPEMAAAEVVATTVASTMASAVTAATSAKRYIRRYDREHDDGNPNA